MKMSNFGRKHSSGYRHMICIGKTKSINKKVYLVLLPHVIDNDNNDDDDDNNNNNNNNNTFKSPLRNAFSPNKCPILSFTLSTKETFKLVCVKTAANDGSLFSIIGNVQIPDPSMA